MHAQLRENPFFVLNVTTRDSRDRILDAAEAASLSGDAGIAQEARSVLTNPRKRLDAEMSWLPGLAPSKAIALARGKPISIEELSELPPLARGNVLANQMESEGYEDAERIRALLKTLIAIEHDLDLSVVAREINEDREISKFPPVSDGAAIESAYAAIRKRWVRSAISSLDMAPTRAVLDAVHSLFDEKVPNGLADELMDAYQLRIASFLDRQADQAHRLCDKILSLGSKPQALAPLIDALAQLLDRWDHVSRPLQVNLASRGLAEPKSEQLGRLVRETAVSLFNKHGRLDEAKSINLVIDKFFAAMPEVAAQASDDAERLAELDAELAQQRESERQFNEEIRYSAEIGTIFRKRIDVDARGLTYDGVTVEFADVQGMRWGATRRSVNGIPTGTDYVVSVRDSRRSLIVEFRNGAIFENLVSRLWRTAGVIILLDFVNRLSSGEILTVGKARVADASVCFSYSKGWGRTEQVELDWADCKVWSADGSFYIGHQDHKKMQISLSYQDVENVHVLEHMVRGAFKKGSGVLSDCLA